MSQGSTEGSEVSERSIEGSRVSEGSVEGYSVGRDHIRVPDTPPTA